jgi:cysteine-rich repeat protein
VTVSLGFVLSVIACSKASPSSPDASPSSPDAATPEGPVFVFPDATPPSKDVGDAGLSLCGNGRQDPGETCDDGNAVGGDGCGKYCWIEEGFSCPTVGQPCISLYACGNGFLLPDEACDDGNTVSGDGCAGNCKQVEPGWRCRVPGKPCVQPCGQDAGDCADGGSVAVCGNGIVEPGEECDDGSDPDKAPHNGDGRYGGCTSACTWAAFCGDGVLNGPETCDDGAENGALYGGGPGCTFACTPAGYCGDGIVNDAEMCDLGSDTGKDECLCTKECKIIQCFPY